MPAGEPGDERAPEQHPRVSRQGAHVPYTHANQSIDHYVVYSKTYRCWILTNFGYKTIRGIARNGVSKDRKLAQEIVEIHEAIIGMTASESESEPWRKRERQKASLPASAPPTWGTW